MGVKKFFIKEENDEGNEKRFLSRNLTYSYNKQIAICFDLLESAKDFVKNNFCDDDCIIMEEKSC